MKAGLPPAMLYDTLADSAGTSRMFQVRGPLMRDAQYDAATATIRTHLKDLEIINRSGAPTIANSTATDAFLSLRNPRAARERRPIIRARINSLAVQAGEPGKQMQEM